MTNTAALWSAVDQLTKPTTMRIHRDDVPKVDLAAELLHDLATNPRRTVCLVAEYRAAAEQAEAQSSGHGTIPSLWDQAVDAVHGQGDSDGGSGTAPARERSVADLALMETLAAVRETVAAEIADHNVTARNSVPAQMRQVASLIIADDDEDTIAWWTWRFDQWARIVGNQINAVDNGPKPIRLRDSPCPECHARKVRVKEMGEWKTVPPLLIDFRLGLVRAVTCSCCGRAWMRGDGLNALGDTLGAGVLADHARSA